ADAAPTNIVMVFATDSDNEYGSSVCTGPDFSNPVNPVDANDFDFPLTTEAELAWKYRATDTSLTPQVEEYVLAFDTEVGRKYKFVPRRAIVQPPPPTASAVQSGQIVLAIIGLIVASIAVFASLRLLVHLFQRRQDVRAETNARTSAMSARL